MADDFAELALSDQEPGANPSLDLITCSPTLHVPAHGFDDGERGLDQRWQRAYLIVRSTLYCRRALPNDTPFPRRPVCTNSTPEPPSTLTKAYVCRLVWSDGGIVIVPLPSGLRT